MTNTEPEDHHSENLNRLTAEVSMLQPLAKFQQEPSRRPTWRLSPDSSRCRTSSAAVIWVTLPPAVERAVLQQLRRDILAQRPAGRTRELEFVRGKGFTLSSLPNCTPTKERKNPVPWDLQRLWLGHANRDVTYIYVEPAERKC
jgi:hypothetical protein